MEDRFSRPLSWIGKLLQYWGFSGYKSRYHLAGWGGGHQTTTHLRGL